MLLSICRLLYLSFQSSHPLLSFLSRQSLHSDLLKPHSLPHCKFPTVTSTCNWPSYSNKDVSAPVSVSSCSHACCYCPTAVGAATARVQHPLCLRHSTIGERQPAHQELRSPCRLSHSLQYHHRLVSLVCCQIIYLVWVTLICYF